MSEYQRKLAGIWKRNNCHPVKSILPILVQAPVFIGFFTSLQSLALAKVLTFTAMTILTQWQSHSHTDIIAQPQ